MIVAKLLPDEQERLKKLAMYEIMDTVEEDNFNELVRLASDICGAPISLISLLDDSRQWFKARVGLEAQETPIEQAFCAHSILQDDIMEVEDATQDDRFFDNPLVTGNPDIRFYAGMPLATPSGHKLGTLCVIDTKPRQLSEKQKESLKVLAKQVITLLELRLKMKELSIANTKLDTQKNIIDKKNRDLMDSINYAKRIQKAILPFYQDVRKSLPDFALFFKPKDVVGGDFYYFRETGNHLVIAVIDCAGHGIPGAFLSLIGFKALKNIIEREGIVDAKEILIRLDGRVIEILHQQDKDSQNKESMDIALCVVDKSKQTITFAGARRDLFVLRKDDTHGYSIRELKGIKFSIGYYATLQEKNFSSETFQIQKDDLFYMFSDGYNDQFGGEHDRKFGRARFKELLLEIAEQPLEEQQESLKKKFDEWSAHTNQTDDVLVIGFKVA